MTNWQRTKEMDWYKQSVGVASGQMRSDDRCVDGEMRDSLRAFGGKIEDGRSGRVGGRYRAWEK